MKVSTYLKSGLGLIYTTIILAATYFGAIWLTKYLILLNWGGAILFWIFGIPIVLGLFQMLASILAIPIVYLMKGAKWQCWILLLPTLFFLFEFGRVLWLLASGLGDLLGWLLAISWFCEISWLFVAYFTISIGSAYNNDGN